MERLGETMGNTIQAVSGQENAMEQAIQEALERLRNQKGAMGSLMALELDECSPEEGTITVSLEPAPWMANSMGWMHGGIISSAMDTAMGTLSRWCAGGEGYTPTVSMQITYLRPVMLSGRVHIRARVTHAGRSLVSLTSELWAGSEKTRLLATASGTYAAMRPQKGVGESGAEK